MADKVIALSHGSGGRKMQKLISGIMIKHFSNPALNRMDDGAVLKNIKNRIVLTTDSFVVSPVFFSGGDIGRLSICGTVNDLTAMGANPKYITAGFIIEEGLPAADLEKIVISMKKTCEEADVVIAAGDTKVVERGKADGIFINTSGVGEIMSKETNVSSHNAKPGDTIIISGTLGDHEIAILKERKGLGFDAKIKSDCAPLNNMIEPLLKAGLDIHVMRDPTRGGLAAVLNEISGSSGVDISIDESKIPVNSIVRSACHIFGYDPFYLANEGKMAIFCCKKDAIKAVGLLKKSRYGKNAAIIGEVAGKNKNGQVLVRTISGGERIILMPDGEQLPRIC